MLSKSSIRKSSGGSLREHQGTLPSSRAALCAVVVAIVAAAFALSWRTRAAVGSDGLGLGQVLTRAKLHAASIAQLPLAFEPNCGQADPRAQFVAHTASATVFLTSTGAAVRAIPVDPSARSRDGTLANQRDPLSGYAVTMNFWGANPRAAAAPVERLPGVSNYFIGNNPANWKTAIPTFAKVRYQSIYPGIDLVYYGNRQQLEYDLIVKRGANAGAVRVAFNGADALELNSSGDALVRSGESEMILRRPMGYQPDGVRQSPVPVSYYKIGRDTLGIRLAKYDRSRPLVIDPMLVYSTYLGHDFAQGQAVAINPAGGAVVAGWIADSSSFPTLTGPFGPAAGSVNAVVTEFNSTGSALLYSSVFGGSKDGTGVAGTSTDEALGVAVDTTGDIFLTGFTNAIDFPIANTSVSGGTTLNRTHNAQVHSDGFVTEFNSNLSSIVYSTYLGGSESDFGNAIAVDNSGNAYVAGSTLSTDFPTSGANAFQQSNPGSGIVEGFVTKLAVSGGKVTAPYSTYFGEPVTSNPLANGTVLTGIAADASNNAYVAGSAGAGFPFPGGSLGNHTFGGTWDAIVARIDTTLSGNASVIWASYLGGSGADWANAITISLGCVKNCGTYVAGGTTSADFPTTADAAAGQTPFQSKLGGYADGFVALLVGTTGAPFYSTLLGGESFDEVRGIAANVLYNNTIVTGVTQSQSFPTVSAASGGLSAALGGPSGALFTSTDGGATLTAVSGWSATHGSIRSSSALAFDPGTSPATIYAGSTTGLWVSTNGGTSFTQPTASGLSGSIESVDFSSAGLFVGTTLGLSLSTNGGISFSQLSGVPTSDTVYQVGTVSQFAGYFTAATSNGLYVTANSGTSFTQATGIPIGTQAFASVIDANSCSGSSCKVYVGTDKGVYSGTLSSSSAALSLTQTQLNFATVTALAADATTSPTTLYAATLGGAGVVASTTGFTTLTNAPQYMTPQNVFSLALDTTTSNPATVHAGATSQALTSVFSSTNAGGSYSQGASKAGSISALQDLSGTLYVGEFLTQDAFVTYLNGYGSQLGFSGYLGGSSYDAGNAIANDAAGNSDTAGATFSTDFPTSGMPSPYQATLGSGSGFVNSFVTEISLDSIVPSIGSVLFGSVEFATTAATSAQETFMLTNATTGTVMFTAAPMVSGVPGEFAVVAGNMCGAAGTTLAAGGSCTVAMTFTPTALGQRMDTVTFTAGAVNAPPVNLVGIGVAPPITYTPLGLAFSSQIVGTTSAAKSITVTNSSAVSVTIGVISSNSDFAIQPSSTCGGVLANGPSSCTISVAFTPSTGTTEMGTISITGNQANSPQKISMSGIGVGATATPTATATATTTATATRTATATPTATSTDTATTSQTATPTATATATMTATATVTATSTGGTPTATATATPTVTPTPVPVTLKIKPRALKFPKTKVSTTSNPKTVKVSNPKGKKKHPGFPVLIEMISDPGVFMETNNCPASLAAGASCSISVTFTPSAPPTKQTGTLTITDNAKHSTETVPLSGTGK
jgi:hypothetical protein